MSLDLKVEGESFVCQKIKALKK